MIKLPIERRKFLWIEAQTSPTDSGGLNDGFRYQWLAMRDYKEIILLLRDRMAGFPEWSFPDDMNLRVDTSEMAAKASIERKLGESGTFITLSAGLMFAIEDLSLRLCTNKDFYSLETFSNTERAWNGCDCIWPYKFSILKPRERFFDYTPEMHDISEAERQGITWLYWFTSAFPMDPRIHLADLMIQIITTFVIAHEQSHGKRGHLGAEAATSSELHLRAPGHVVASKYKELSILNSNKVAEFEADRDAIRCVMDLFFTKEAADSLPSYTQSNRGAWLMRLILGSINALFLVLQNARLRHFATDSTTPDTAHPLDSHPTPRTRIAVLYQSAFERLEENGWRDLLEVSEYDHFEAEFFLKSLGDSLEDLNTATEIFRRETNDENELDVYEEGCRPMFKEKKFLHALDQRKDVVLVIELFYKKILPNDPGFNFFDRPESIERLRELQELWFEEYDTELFPYFRLMRNGGLFSQ